MFMPHLALCRVTERMTARGTSWMQEGYRLMADRCTCATSETCPVHPPGAQVTLVLDPRTCMDAIAAILALIDEQEEVIDATCGPDDLPDIMSDVVLVEAIKAVLEEQGLLETGSDDTL